MRLDLFLIIGLVVNTMFAVLYPAQIFGNDPLGINAIKEEKATLNQYFSVNGTSIVNQYDPVTGQLIQNKDLTNQLKGAIESTQGDSGLIIGELFSFVDWVKVGFNLLKTMFMFVLGFVVMLWQLVYPFNFLIGIPFSMLYLFSMVSFIIGR